ERRRRTLDGLVAEVGIPQGGEGVVAHVEGTRGDVSVARDREVPGEVEVPALDSRLAQRVEDPLEVPAPPIDRRLPRGQAVTVVAESRRRLDRGAAGGLQIAKRDDVPVSRGEVRRRVDQERGARGARRVG